MSGDDKTSGWQSRLTDWAKKAESDARAWAERADASLRELANNPTVQAGQRAAEGALAWGQRLADSDAVREARATLEASPVWVETAKAAERVRTSEAWRQLEEAAEQAAEGTRRAARSAGERLAEVQRDLEALLAAVERAGRDPNDRAAVVAAAEDAFERVGGQLDLLADGVAVGFLREAGAGVASVQGTELFFVPADGPVRAQLRLSRIIGQSARLAVGGQVGGYVAAMYGPRARLVRPFDRRGADLGLLVASLGFFRGSDDTAGWLFELAAGASLGIPFLSDMSAFELEEVNLASYALTPEETARFESALAQAPDRPRRRHIAQMLRKPDPDPASK